MTHLSKHNPTFKDIQKFVNKELKNPNSNMYAWACNIYKGATMTPEQEKHLDSIKNTFDIEVDRKYRRGQLEHGGDLFSKTPTELLNDALDECIDMFVFLTTIKQKING